MRVDGQLYRAQLECRTSDLANTITGAIWYRTDTSVVKIATGASILQMSFAAADGSTLQEVANVLSIKDLGVSTGKIAANAVTGAKMSVKPELKYFSYLSNDTLVIPSGVVSVMIFGFGGGGGGGAGESTPNDIGGDGGCGALPMFTQVAVVAGETLTIVVGAGGASGTAGSDSTVTGSSSGLLATFKGGRAGGASASATARRIPLYNGGYGSDGAAGTDGERLPGFSGAGGTGGAAVGLNGGGGGGGAGPHGAGGNGAAGATSPAGAAAGSAAGANTGAGGGGGGASTDNNGGAGGAGGSGAVKIGYIATPT